MIKHSLKDDLLHLSIENVDFSYRIPVKKLGNTIHWKIGGKNTEGIVIQNVSKWALQLFTKNVTEEKYLTQFKTIVQAHCPDESIDWKETKLALNLQNEYNAQSATNATLLQKKSEEEILSEIETKFNID